MNKTVFAVAGTALVLALQGMAWADDHPTPELKKELYGKWRRADTDQDGKVSYDEFKIIQEEKNRRIFASMDLNGDGFVDAEEEHNDRDGRQVVQDDCANSAKPEKARDGKKKSY